MYFEEIPVNDFLTLKSKMVDFSIRDLEDISLFLFDKDEDIEWGLHEKTQTFNIGYWSTSTNINRLIGREVKTSTVTIATTTFTPDVKSTKGQPRKFKLSLFKCEDDWFLAQLFINYEFRYQDEGFWIKIDQIDGVISFLENLFKNCPVFNYTRVEGILDEIITKNSSDNRYLPYLFNPNQIDVWLQQIRDTY